MAELNPNAKLWVDALRSGKYKQGKYVLTEITDNDEFDCCLGVACKVAVENGVTLTTEIYYGARRARGYDFSTKTLPSSVIGWLGLSEGAGLYRTELNGVNRHFSLTDDNDSGKTFEQIASIIESKPQGLFIEGQ